MTGLDRRFDSIVESVGPLCVGIDPSSETLRRLSLSDSAEGALVLSRAIMGGAHGLVGILKPQIAYFERFGTMGYSVLETVIREARDAGFAVIADAKRGDIGSTMAGYAEAWLGNGTLTSDALTVSPYQGFDALEPAFAAAEKAESVVFVLAATSNIDARDIQRAMVDGQSLPATVARMARERSMGKRTVGVVVGATRNLESSGLTEADLEDILVLAPGFGAQGARLEDLRTIFGAVSRRVVPSVSRSIVEHGLDGISRSIGGHLRELGL